MTPKARLRIRGARHALDLEAAIDTGFNGHVCVPKKLAVKLGLELAGSIPVELADGSMKTDLFFRAQVRFLGRTRSVRALLTDSDEALIGTALLAGCMMMVDFESGQVRLKRKQR